MSEIPDKLPWQVVHDAQVEENLLPEIQRPLEAPPKGGLASKALLPAAAAVEASGESKPASTAYTASTASNGRTAERPTARLARARDPISQTESLLISAIFHSGNDFGKAFRLISPEWINSPFHRKAFQVAQELVSEPGTTLTLSGWVIGLVRASGSEYGAVSERLARLISGPGSPENIPAYAKILRSDWERRSLWKISTEVAQQLTAQTADVEAAARQLRGADQLLLGRAVESVSGVDALAKASVQDSTVRPVPTGFSVIDRMLKGGGLRPGNYCVVGGRPSMGKTAFVATVARNAALSGFSVGFVTLEMTDSELAERIALHKPECLRLIHFAMPRKGTVRAIEQIAARWKADDLLDFLVIDYLGLMYPEGRRVSRYEDVSDISQDLKRLARSLEVPLMVAAQLNRGLVGRTDKKPMLADFRDSGSIEQDCDQAILLHRPGYYSGNRNDPVAYADLAKQRNGPTDDVRLTWLASQSRFTDYNPFPG